MSSSTKKFLVCTVIFLFIALLFTSTINATYNTTHGVKLFNVEITEYRSDGSIEKNIVELTKAELLELKRDYLTAKNLEQKFSVFKNIGLISQDMKLTDLEQGMYQKAEQMGISKNIDSSRIMIRPPILFTLFNGISAVYFGGVSLSIGLSPIMRLFNLPGIDIADFVGGLFGVTHTEGLFYKQTMIIFPGFSAMIGFVGISLKIPLFMQIFTGFSVATVGLGLGIKLKEWIF